MERGNGISVRQAPPESGSKPQLGSQHLLMLLIYSRGEGIRRIRLLEQLYGDSDTEQAANSLRAMIFRLRKSLIAAGLPDGEYISTTLSAHTICTMALFAAIAAYAVA